VHASVARGFQACLLRSRHGRRLSTWSPLASADVLSLALGGAPDWRLPLVLAFLFGFAEIAIGAWRRGWGGARGIAFPRPECFSPALWHALACAAPPRRCHHLQSSCAGSASGQHLLSFTVAHIGGKWSGARLCDRGGVPPADAVLSEFTSPYQEMMSSKSSFTLPSLALLVPGLHDAERPVYPSASFVAIAHRVVAFISAQRF